MKTARSKLFENGFARLKKIDPRIIGKLKELTDAISKSPRSGIGHPEQLKGYWPQIVWSRHITRKHRLVYEIRDKENCIVFLSCYGHYKDH